MCSGWKHHHWSFVSTTYLFQAFTIIFPTLFPVNNPKNASGIFSKPSTMVSWVLIFPSFTHCAIWVMPSFQRFAHLETIKPSILSCWNLSHLKFRYSRRPEYKKIFIWQFTYYFIEFWWVVIWFFFLFWYTLLHLFFLKVIRKL